MPKQTTMLIAVIHAVRSRNDMMRSRPEKCV
jgi:hypothetical protein